MLMRPGRTLGTTLAVVAGCALVALVGFPGSATAPGEVAPLPSPLDAGSTDVDGPSPLAPPGTGGDTPPAGATTSGSGTPPAGAPAAPGGTSTDG